MRISRFWYIAFLSLLIISVIDFNDFNFVGETPVEIKKEEFRRKHDRIERAIDKYDGPNEFYKYHTEIRNNPNAAEKKYPQSYLTNELLAAKTSTEFKRKSALRTQSLEFKERGPFNVPGRTRSLITLPDDPENHWLAGAVGGGIWETENAGNTWLNRTQDIPSLAVSCMDICRTSPEIIYAGTGEGYFNIDALDGIGILKSVDGGESWNLLESTAYDDRFGVVTRIVIDHENPDVLLATTYSRASSSFGRSLIVKSIDGGGSWYIVYESSYHLTQIISNPDNFNTQFASHRDLNTRTASVPNAVILKSIDGGENWEPSGTGISSIIGRVELAIAPTDTSFVYATAEGNLTGAGADLFVSSDGGSNWQLVNQSYENESVDFFDGQGWYDNTIAVNPFDELEVYYGGVNLWRSNISPGKTLESRHVIDVEFYRDDNTMWSLVNFGADYYNGKIELSTELDVEEFKTVAIITGPDVTQKAYRFTVDKRGAGVPDEDYEYQDYVDVPFQVWDIEDSRQLMVSFRDQQEDSIFNLLEQNTIEGQEQFHSREYIYIHTVDYSETENGAIARDGGEKQGHKYKNMYFLWPTLVEGLVWDEAKLVTDTFMISHDYVESFIIEGEMTNISDAYGNYSSINTISAAFENALHPDHHFLKMVPVNIDEKTFRIISTNDGGVFVSNVDTLPGSKNNDWTFSGYGYNTGQFYGAAKQPGAEVFIGGLQDNGTWKSPEENTAEFDTEYEFQVGGDGFDVIWNSRRSRQIIASSQFNNFSRTKNGGANWERVGQEMKGVKPFLSKLSNSNANPEVLFTVTSEGVYRSPNFGTEWILSSIDNNWGFSNTTRIEVSLSNPDIVWAGTGMSTDRKMQVSTDGGVTFTEVNNFSDDPFPSISGFATHPYEDSTAYALFSYAKSTKIIRTTDLGDTWEDISGFNNNEVSNNGFPDVAVLSLLVRPDAPEVIWAGTEIGIFESDNNGAGWYLLDNEMGAASVWDMTVMDDQVVVATHGRGIFTATLNEPIEITFKPEISAAGMDINDNFNISASLPSVYDSVKISIDDTFISFAASSGIGKAVYEISGLASKDSLAVRLFAYRKGKEYPSNAIAATVFDVEKPLASYSTDFETNAEDFAGFGFSVRSENGFDDLALHSAHPYLEADQFEIDEIDFLYYLRTPIVISDRNARIYYDNIALIELGENGSSYPNENFFDFVSIEGSSNGLDWKSLAPGYDSREHDSWESAYLGNDSGDQSLMKTMIIDLKESYAAEDTVLLRFRLNSNKLVSGWGWIIDNLFIQSIVTDVEEDELDGDEIVIFPNPAWQELNITNYRNEQSADLLIYTMSGAIIRKMQLPISLNRNQVKIDVSDLRAGVYMLKIKSSNLEFSSKLVIK